jgi:tRNA modification GTPase
MTDTIAALATPRGESALALIRVSGPDTIAVAQALLGRPPPPRRAVHADYHDVSGHLLDDAIFVCFQGPASFSGEDALEISCHGSPFIVERILEDLMTRGCRAAEPGEFSRRAFLNGRLDLSQAEAVMDLIRARSDRAVEAAHRQLRGALGRETRRLVDALLDVVAGVEAYIDFPEDDLPAEDRQRSLAAVREVSRAAGRLLATGRYGSLIRDGVRVVLAGEPNAGKSSLLNRLIGYERALVDAGPGTTRDFIEERVLLGAHSIRYLDTAGLRTGGDGVERAGMGKTLEQVADADILLLVLDAARPFPTLPEPVMERASGGPTLVVWNKVDLAPAGPVPEVLGPLPSLALCARTGQGLEALQAAILDWVESSRIEIGDEVIAISVRHEHALQGMHGCLAQAEAKLAGDEDLELIASDLRGAIDCLGQITGRIDNEAVLDHLFASFCIGK